MDWHQLLPVMATSLGFGGATGAVVGFTAKKLTKVVALALGATFIVMQVLSSYGWVSVDWLAMENDAARMWDGVSGMAAPDRLWAMLVANIPFAGAFSAGFVVGFKMG